MDPCPHRDDLKAFAVGDLHGERLENIVAHIAECQTCDNALESLDSYSDALVSDLKELPQREPEAVPERIFNAANAGASGTQKRSAGDLDPGRACAIRLADGPVRLGKFELRSELGDGAFGYVFKARDLELDRDVAVKVSRAGSLAGDEDVDAFLREARAAAQLSHPNIVAIESSGQTDDGVCYLVSEFVEGENLKRRLGRGRFDFRQAAELVAELADALAYAHAHDVVHRDIKPSNIIVDTEGRPHLTDFGLAKLLTAEQSITAAGEVMGTPAYMAPEQARGDSRSVDARSDVYSLGVLFYELLTGDRPFQGRGRQVLLQVLEDEPQPLRRLNDRIPIDLETVCLKAMAKRRGNRYAGADDLADDLRRFLLGEAIAARTVGRFERVWRWSQKNPLAASMFVAVVAGSIVGFLYLSQLSNSLIRDSALDGVRREADLFEGTNLYYSDVIMGLKNVDWDTGDPTRPPDPEKIKITHQYATMIDALPYPKTFTKDAAQRISDNVPGMSVRLYSDRPWRIDGGPLNDFERIALTELRDKAGRGETNLEHFEIQERGEPPSVVYARAQLMQETCIYCHNTHMSSPRRDWKVGDVAGVLAITRPLDADIKRTRRGMRGAFAMVAATAVTLLSLSLVLLPKRGA